jgi:hypothetical protein
MRQLVPRVKRDRISAGARRKTARRGDAHQIMSNARRPSAVLTFLQRALAVLFVVLVHAFLLNVPHPPSPALGVAYAFSALCLAIAAWRLWSASEAYEA